MHRSLSLLVCFSLSTLAACSERAPDDAPEPVSEDRSPIIGGLPDLGRSYVVGIGDTSSVYCTGTLISRRTVLTAGHCFGGISQVYFGPKLALRRAPITVAVTEEVRHPGFNKDTLKNDLAIVHLAEDAPSQPVPLLRETLDSSFIGPSFTFVGYGNDGKSSYDIRRVATFPIGAIGPADVGLDSKTGPIDETMFFYAVPLKNTCDGDSGGPAFVARNHVERAVGATSYGDRPCKIDGVDARTDTPAIEAFIQPMIDQFEGADPCRANGVCDESCNENNTLVDPDCAENHCGADGMCVISCVDPVDPDCAGVDHCLADGVCDPGCARPDVDCVTPPPLPGGGTPDSGQGGAGGGGEGGGGGSSSSASGDSSSSSGSGAGVGGGSSATGAGGSDMPPPDTDEQEGGCGCRTAERGAGSEGRLGVLLSLGVLGVWRRRRARACAQDDGSSPPSQSAGGTKQLRPLPQWCGCARPSSAPAVSMVTRHQ